MRAGAMDCRCSVLKEQQVDDGMGGGAIGWVKLRDIWAEITLPGGRSAVVAQQVTAEVTAEIHCRPADDLVAGLRLTYGAATYKVEAALLDKKLDMLRLLCSNVPHP